MTERYLLKFVTFVDDAVRADPQRAATIGLEGLQARAARVGVNLIGEPWIRWPPSWGTPHDAPEGQAKLVARSYCD